MCEAAFIGAGRIGRGRYNAIWKAVDILSSSIGLWLPHSTAIPAEFKSTGIFLQHLVTTAQTASAG